MKKTLRYLSLLLAVGTLTLFSLSARFSTAFSAATATPGPKAKPLPLPLDAPAGHSDGILVLGILIFIIIAIPTLISYQNLRSQQ